jgi:NADPH2:quinone reductase
MAGPTISLSAAALRSSGIELSGSGGGGIPPTAIFETFPQLWALAGAGRLRIDTEPVRLREVELAWQRNDLPGRRIVVVP